MMQAWARAGAAMVLVTLLAGCSPTSVPATAAPTPVGPADTVPASSSPSATPIAAAPTAHPTPSFSPAAAKSTAPSRVPPSPARASRAPGPSVDPSAIAAYLTATITLLDLSDAGLAVGVTYIDPASGQTADLGTYSLASSERLSNSVPPAGIGSTCARPASRLARAARSRSRLATPTRSSRWRAPLP